MLLGNAAHTIHPNGAQGFNLVLRDVAGLVEYLAAALRDGGDVGSREVLASYILSRKRDQRQVIRFTDAMHWAFNNTNPLKSVARNTAMFVLERAAGPEKRVYQTGIGSPEDRRRKTEDGGLNQRAERMTVILVSHPPFQRKLESSKLTFLLIMNKLSTGFRACSGML